MRPPKVMKDLASIDRDLGRMRGLEALPGWVGKVDDLLDKRLALMAERDRGFRVTNLRRGPSL